MRYYERIRQLRKENGYTQTHIAQILHVAQTTYSDYEHGYVRTSLEHVIELARFYDVDLDFLLCASDIRKPFPKE